MDGFYYHMTAPQKGGTQDNPQNNAKMSKNSRIKTNIKFQPEGDGGKLVGFITKSNGSWRGCREDYQGKKKIVILDYRLTKATRPNVLYKCSLVPMRDGDGYIAVTAELVRFKAKILTTWNNGTYCVRVEFGNKAVIYDPNSPHPSENDIQTVAALIRARVDLADPLRIAEEFVNSACLCRSMNQSKKIFNAC